MIRVFIFNCSKKCILSVPDDCLSGIFEFAKSIQTLEFSNIVEFTVLKSAFGHDINIRLMLTPLSKCNDFKVSLINFLNIYYEEL